MLEVPSIAEHKALAAQVAALTERLTYAELVADQWVKPTVAARVTGRDEKTLRVERERPDTLIVWRGEARKIEYSLLSLREYNKRRGYTPSITAERVQAARS
jgi:hypothetical protein